MIRDRYDSLWPRVNRVETNPDKTRDSSSTDTFLSAEGSVTPDYFNEFRSHVLGSLSKTPNTPAIKIAETKKQPIQKPTSTTETTTNPNPERQASNQRRVAAELIYYTEDDEERKSDVSGETSDSGRLYENDWARDGDDESQDGNDDRSRVEVSLLRAGTIGAHLALVDWLTSGFSLLIRSHRR